MDFFFLKQNLSSSGAAERKIMQIGPELKKWPAFEVGVQFGQFRYIGILVTSGPFFWLKLAQGPPKSAGIAKVKKLGFFKVNSGQ